ncbi:glycoside hydrolase family 5 protein [Niabella pedocola]|uniref:Glycoside hydrolase family 5 protein n=1 Tax=Niabella pedocola TaxID=1752077 RepID=A0ABS8PP46_9BACT|nr:cellulase family glycosylhydrolase [Niabella pedocola]MCD2422524.1 glycoside hydrolase family 5 protein [Niabella pedocola]
MKKNDLSRCGKSTLRVFWMVVLMAAIWLPHATGQQQARARWTEKQAASWYAQQRWLVGANFLPSTAINQLEMFRPESFDTATISREFAYAHSLGMNTMRVYLHDLLYLYDREGFFKRLDIVLGLAEKQGIRLLLTIFDSCWDPYPRWGTQPAPRPHVHNSGWVQSPGVQALKDTAGYGRLETYVKDLLRRFGKDKRVLAWDVWNEPDNRNIPSYDQLELPDKTVYVLPLLKKVFEWARAVHPSQPLTSGIWAGSNWSEAHLRPIDKLQLEQSDIITFHSYDQPELFEKKIRWLQRFNRPIICTEYMARPNGSTFESFLPIAKKYRVGMINWGFVAGKSQTIYAWDSWTKTYDAEPELWFHDIFRTDGTPYRNAEVDFIRKMTGH